MSWQFREGQQVVCIFDGEWGYVSGGGYSVPTRVPMFNEVLTIRRLNWAETRGELFLEFEEIPLKQIDGRLSADITYRAAHFRPLRERKTDISIFRAMLNPVRERADA